MTPEEKLDQLSSTVQKLAHQIELNSNKSEKKELEEKLEKLRNQKESSGPWWSTLIKFLGLPAALVLIVLNFKQTGNVDANTQKADAETEKIKLEMLEMRLKLLTDSISVEKIKTVEDRFKIKKEIDELSAIVGEIKALKASDGANVLINKFIVIYLFYIGLGLIFSAFSFLWNNLVSLLFRFLSNKFYRARSKIDYEDTKGKEAIEKKIKALEWSIIAVSPIPALFDLIVQVLVFVFVIVPVFDQASKELNSDTTFADIVDAIKYFDMNGMVNALKDILF